MTLQGLDRDELERRLAAAFGGEPGERRAVVRAAADLADLGQYRRDAGIELTTEFVIAELRDAPRGSPSERWNWWMRALEVAFGGYEQFTVWQWETASESARKSGADTDPDGETDPDTDPDPNRGP
jgi:hypothetical protein